MGRGSVCLGVLAVVGLFTTEGSAFAHISIDQGGTQLSRYGDTELKDAPCGRANGTRGTHIYHYNPGQTIKVAMVEFVAHPSYFRIAFDDDGDDGFIEPQSIQPIDPTRPCPYNAADKCGPPDYYNSPAVLPGMDDLYPHLPTGFLDTAKYTFEVTLPNITCDNCTLQIIQVMEDTVHGAYNPTPGDPNDNPYIPDIYHQCIDIVLRPGSDGGMFGPDASSTQAGSSGKDEGGCTLARGRSTSGAAYWWAAFALGALGVRRSNPRRRTR